MKDTYTRSVMHMVPLDDLSAAFHKIERTDPIVRVRVNRSMLEALKREARVEDYNKSSVPTFRGVDIIETNTLPDASFVMEYASGRKVVHFADGSVLALERVRLGDE